ILGQVKEELEVIPGSVPNLIDLPEGCKFAPRCRARVENDLEICTEKEPDLMELSSGHTVRCWLYQEEDGHPRTGALR
ncbi:MAG: methionine ABC transporter ATP-binding protein, partial [Anaerolineales bacterium]|nr:methionine ABC transporter ATP-binding protein [Anaerolineales bacterium]